MRSITRASGCLFGLLGVALLWQANGLRAQEKSAPASPHADVGPILKDQGLASKLHSPVDARPALTERLRSPREMLKSLYYAVATFDLYPEMIDEATDCLDLGSLPPISAEEASFLVLELERLLQGLDLPLKSVPDNSINDKVTLYDADGFKISARLCPDKCWRIDADTLELHSDHAPGGWRAPQVDDRRAGADERELLRPENHDAQIHEPPASRAITTAPRTPSISVRCRASYGVSAGPCWPSSSPS